MSSQAFRMFWFTVATIVATVLGHYHSSYLWFFGGFAGTYLLSIPTIYLLSFIYATIVFVGSSYLPCSVQRPIYEHWKEHIRSCMGHNPLYDFSLAVYMASELDKQFEQGGIRQARKALAEWSEKRTAEIQEMLDQSKDVPVDPERNEQ